MRLLFPSHRYIRMYVRTHARTKPAVSIDSWLINCSTHIMHEHVDTIEFVINSCVQDITVSKMFRSLTLGVRIVVCL